MTCLFSFLWFCDVLGIFFLVYFVELFSSHDLFA
ncbi:hypothetical protein OGCDGJMD_00439 [Cyanobium usitatum str. Tous]|nr:hypothetical protein OGCDGJMD_00439 [Cyanobium usitatum str. Tous]